MEFLPGMRVGSRQNFLVLAVKKESNGFTEYTYVLTFRDNVWEFGTHTIDPVNGELHFSHYFSNIEAAVNDFKER